MANLLQQPQNIRLVEWLLFDFKQPINICQQRLQVLFLDVGRCRGECWLYFVSYNRHGFKDIFISFEHYDYKFVLKNWPLLVWWNIRNLCKKEKKSFVLIRCLHVQYVEIWARHLSKRIWWSSVDRQAFQSLLTLLYTFIATCKFYIHEKMCSRFVWAIQYSYLQSG